VFEELTYDAKTGYFYNKKGKRLGRQEPHGYIKLYYKGKKYYAHRVAWYKTYGRWPESDIDHINRKRHDNRLKNLRDVKHYVNNHNVIKPQPYNKTSKVRGVHRHSVNPKWIAQITINGKMKHLGSFDTIQQAKHAYEAAKATVK